MRGEGATWHENQLVPIIRHGALQDVYWTYSLAPSMSRNLLTGSVVCWSSAPRRPTKCWLSGGFQPT